MKVGHQVDGDPRRPGGAAGDLRGLVPYQLHAQARAAELPDRFGLGEKRAGYPDRLSGGQQQRAATVRALAMQPRLMLLDEVTSAPDPELVADVVDPIRELAEGGMTMLIATHEMGSRATSPAGSASWPTGRSRNSRRPAIVQSAGGRENPALPAAHHRRRAPVGRQRVENRR